MRWCTRTLIRLYPVAFRGRYGDELTDLLSASDRPGRDALDLLVHIARAHLEVPMTRLVRHATAASAAVALVLLGLVLGELRHGVVDIPQHWWSALAAVAAVVSGGAVAVVHRQAPRRNP